MPTKPLLTSCFVSICLFSAISETLAFGIVSPTTSKVGFQPKPTTFADVSPQKHQPCVSYSHSRDFKLYMGWGPEPIWSAAKVESNINSSPSGQFVQVTVDVPAEVIEGYKVPGQYVQLKENDSEDAKPLFLAIASPPLPTTSNDENDESTVVTNTKMEFLIKKTDNNDWITSAGASKEVYISQVMGGGFAMQENFEGFKYDFPCQNVLLFANGSGIAPLRAAIESSQLNIAKPGQGGRTARLYYGVTTPADMPYADKFREWEMNGVEVVPVVSRPEECEWNGRTGYVQNALEEDGVPIPRNSGALLCGVKGMAESVKDLLAKAGEFFIFP